MPISKRIKTIANFVDPGDVVADVGADHGLLELYLLAKDPNTKVVAIENKIGPYKILDRNLRGFKNIRLSLSDGLEAVDLSVKTIVIAGMGGLNIRKILDRYPKKVKRVSKIIIDAHRDKRIARETIVNYGFKIEKEKIVFEQNKFYVVILFKKFEKQTFKYSEDELDFGYKIYEDELWPLYKEYLINKNKQTIKKIYRQKSMKDKVLKLKEMNERLEKYGKN